jgi:D-glycero-D-manno-heptose 1,7-bisphosphate phosphatase
VGVNTVSRDTWRAVFLDRDGVLNRPTVRDGKPYPPVSPAAIEILPDARPALVDLKELGFLLLVVSNQPDVARGTQKRAVVEAMNSVLKSALPLDDFFVCYHDDGHRCECRKPLPGLLFQAAERYSIDLSSSFLIGDRWRDIDAGSRAGCKTILIDCGYRERQPSKDPDARVQSLRAAADWILNHAR